MKNLTKKLAVIALAAAVGTSSACDDFLDVDNPNNLEAEAIDEERDRTVLSQSAWQSFVSRYGEIMVYVAWFTGEGRVGDTFPTRNEFGRRDIPEGNTHTTSMWNGLHNSVQFAQETARRIEPAGNSLDLARAYFTAGYALLLTGELFCEGTVAENWTTPRGPMTSAQVLDTAIARLTKANEIAKGLTGTEASNIATASLVGIARAHLQNGRKAQASTFAAQVPSNFVFNLLHMDDPSNRGLGNTLWSYSEARISLVTPPEYKAMAAAGDTRIAWVDMKRPAQDGVLNFDRQNKYKGWGDVERLASGLEAQYIKVEADGNAAAILTFINTRRAAGNQTALAATSDLNVLLRELMEQKSRDFWLEGKRVGDLRRNPSHVPYVLPPGDTYYKSSVGLVSTQVCWPLPMSEKQNNPNFPKG
jgi:starch-binding outer membrane protein, SusD/RagB family